MNRRQRKKHVKKVFEYWQAGHIQMLADIPPLTVDMLLEAQASYRSVGRFARDDRPRLLMPGEVNKETRP